MSYDSNKKMVACFRSSIHLVILSSFVRCLYYLWWHFFAVWWCGVRLALQPEILSERFRRQETVTLGEALFLIDKVNPGQFNIHALVLLSRPIIFYSDSLRR